MVTAPDAARVFLLRHCQAEGQAEAAPLTPAGHAQAEVLAGRLAGAGIDRIVASPTLRTRQSVEPLARRLELPVHTDARLAERVLGTDLPDWRAALRAACLDPELCHPGGESSRAATARGLAALADARRSGARLPLLVTHGNLLALLLHALDGRDSFTTWERLGNPDLFLVAPGETIRVDRCPVACGDCA
jgi:2,3-bisphosphoglycerate-dependent phosphoglycerate mutase